MIIYPEEKVIKHKGFEYPFDEEAIQYCVVPTGYQEKQSLTGELYQFPVYIDVDILHALVGVASGDLTVQEAFLYLKKSINVLCEMKTVK